MPAILQQLQPYKPTAGKFLFEKKVPWNFPSILAAQDSDFFRPLLEHHHQLSLEYSVYCTQLAKDILDNKTDIVPQLKTALMMSELLECIYRDYLNVPREVHSLRLDQQVYRQALMNFCSFSEFEGREYQPLSLNSRKIRDLTVMLNWARLSSLRMRRLLIVSPLIINLNIYHYWIGTFEQFSAPVVRHITWIFFLPRLMTNLMLTAKHLIPGPWMSEQEKTLTLQTRFRGQMERRWFELGNDIVWFTAGLVNAFVLTGALAPAGFYLNLALQVYDLLLAIIRARLELNRLSEIEATYQTLLLSDENQEEIQNYLPYLEAKITTEQQRLYLAVFNTSVLVLAASLALPIVAFNPLVPVLGALLAVVITVINYTGIRSLEKQRPLDKITTPLLANSLWGKKHLPHVLVDEHDQQLYPLKI